MHSIFQQVDFMTQTSFKHPIYLDHNGTTPIAPEAIQAMTPYMTDHFGNPSSSHELGTKAKQGVENARKQVAHLLGADPGEILFTSGGTESNNMVLKGLVDFRNPSKFHMITSAIEHPAILNPALYLMELGAKVTVLPVDSQCRVDPEQVQKAILPETRLISLMLANNETGTLQPVFEIARMAQAQNILLHTDAAQAVGKIPIQVKELGIDFLSVAGHKLYGPKGVGALYIKKGLSLTPLVHGAGQEDGRRAGTENTILVVGLGEACEVASKRLSEDMKQISHLRDHFQNQLFDGITGLVLNGHPEKRLPNTLNVAVPGLEGGKILENLPQIMASTGAACHEQGVTLSHVLAAMGVSSHVGMGALRFTLGRGNTKEDIETAAVMIMDQIKRMRNG